MLSLLHLQPSYSNFVGFVDENASSYSRVCGLVYLWSVACEPYYCFVNKVDELNESVPMDVDRVILVKAWNDMEIDNDPMEVNNDLQDHMEIHNDPMEVN